MVLLAETASFLSESFNEISLILFAMNLTEVKRSQSFIATRLPGLNGTNHSLKLTESLNLAMNIFEELHIRHTYYINLNQEVCNDNNKAIP